ncbi:hypothetical protein [Alkalibacillus salilacus]|uniref:Uncharacterized protein n=1 Tax=Alkalibacillus salilacus TaxID=284582 RepID=A0ABT9VFJ6_9BACI|nr:hypothetical protein [Alkalibacillus salilacus]MDQ0159742.1 hypothetical protein [Alkalibacillus salilacus]
MRCKLNDNPSIITQVIEQIDEDLRSYCRQLLEEPLEKVVQDIIEEHLLDDEGNFLSIKNLMVAHLHLKRNVIAKRKRQWAYYDINKLNHSLKIYNEIDEGNQSLKGGDSLITETPVVHNSDTESAAEFIERVTNDVREWQQDERQYLCNYPYFSRKKLKKQREAVVIDLNNFVMNCILNQFGPIIDPDYYSNPGARTFINQI